jgi:anti-sigma factor RsiW
MNCRNAKKAIHSILTETATAQETMAFQKHLLDCPRCSGLYSGLTETADLLSRLTHPKVSAEFDESFARRLRAANTSSTRTGHILSRAITAIGQSRWLWAFSVGAAVIFLALLHAQLPKEVEKPLSFSSINMLAMLLIIMIASTIIRSALESDFRLFSFFRRAIQ